MCTDAPFSNAHSLDMFFCFWLTWPGDVMSKPKTRGKLDKGVPMALVVSAA